MFHRVNCPCPEQGGTPNSQLSSAIFAPILPIEPDDHDQIIHRVPVNGLIVILRFFGPVRDRGYPNDPGSLFPYRIAIIWTF